MNPPDPDLYLVRVWRGTGFRAVARRVDEEAQHCLNSPEALAAYLAAGTPVNEPGAALPPRHQATPPAAAQGNAGPPQVALTPSGGGLGAARPWGPTEKENTP